MGGSPGSRGAARRPAYIHSSLLAQRHWSLWTTSFKKLSIGLWNKRNKRLSWVFRIALARLACQVPLKALLVGRKAPVRIWASTERRVVVVRDRLRARRGTAAAVTLGKQETKNSLVVVGDKPSCHERILIYERASSVGGGFGDLFSITPASRLSSFTSFTASCLPGN